MYGWAFILWKMLKYGTAKVRLGCSIVQKGEIRYGFGFNRFEMQK